VRAPVARVDVHWEEQLVPIDDTSVNAPTLGSFDRAAAASSLGAINVQHCGSSGQVGTGHATVTFNAQGRVSNVIVDDANFAGSPAGRCVQAAFFSARAPAFNAQSASIGKSFTIGNPLAR
jgi:hypothetical protein